MHLSELQTKMVINTNDGKHLGAIVDAEVTGTGQIKKLTIMQRRFFRRLFKNETEVNVTFEQIVKIGEDVILADL